MAIFRRPVIQVAIGVLAGTAFVTFLAVGINGGELPLKATGMIAIYATAMMLFCMLACIVPTRRALSVEATEALKAE